jgi:hypothetical protein
MIAGLKVNQEHERQPQMGSNGLCCESAAKEARGLGQAVNDHYRCPENFFDFVLTEQLSLNRGYFRLGPHAICYGRSCSRALESRPKSTLHDEIGNVIVKDGKLHLPFDPTEIIDNLRLERYASAQQMRSNFEHFLRRLYYLFRPAMNLSVRKQIQKFHSRNWEKQPFPKWPVDTTVEDICEILLLLSMEARGVNRVPFVWFWPDGANGCLAMTHDIETTAGRDHCEELMKVDDSFGIKSAFGIVPEGRYEVTPSFLKSMRDRGFEVVVQDLNHDGRLFDNEGEFLHRAKKINRYGCEYGAKGFRAGVLYRNPEWYDALEFAFDMSIPNVAHLDPQHGGCCTVMPYFIGEVLEIPVTTVQDYMLFYILNTRSTDLWKKQLDLILGKNGLASFIVHPDYLLQNDTVSVYEKLLSYLRELRNRKAIWFALPTDIDSWWRARSKMSVVKDGNSWRIEGDVTKRARLAYARNVGGKLVYEVAQRPEVGMPNQG